MSATIQTENNEIVWNGDETTLTFQSPDNTFNNMLDFIEEWETGTHYDVKSLENNEVRIKSRGKVQLNPRFHAILQSNDEKDTPHVNLVFDYFPIQRRFEVGLVSVLATSNVIIDFNNANIWDNWISIWKQMKLDYVDRFSADFITIVDHTFVEEEEEDDVSDVESDDGSDLD